MPLNRLITQNEQIKYFFKYMKEPSRPGERPGFLMEERMKITLKEWALRHGVAPATARQKALRGGFKTAEKVGRDWMIDEDEPKMDLRKERTKK